MTHAAVDRSADLFPWWVRAILIFVALQALLLVVVFFQTDLVILLVPWTATPLNARFIASLYTSLGLGILVSAFARQLVQARIILVGIALATALLFMITLPYIPALKPFPTMWMTFYTIDPLLVVFAFWRLRGQWGESPRVRNPLALFWAAQAVFFLVIIGLPMLFFSSLAVNLWPWSLSLPLAQLYSAFFITLGAGCFLAARDSRWTAAQILAWSSFALAVFVLAVSIYHLDRFKPGLPTIVWFAILGIEAFLFGGLTIFKGLWRAPNHKGMPVWTNAQQPAYLERQVLSSRNVAAHPLWDFIYGGLNYQIEHHLFPTMPRANFKRAHTIIRPFCLAHGLTYEEMHPWSSFRAVYAGLRRVGLAAG